MVTMDDDLNVMLWQYSLPHFSGFGWCVMTGKSPVSRVTFSLHLSTSLSAQPAIIILRSTVRYQPQKKVRLALQAHVYLPVRDNSPELLYETPPKKVSIELLQ
jgi:hypothetical protein